VFRILPISSDEEDEEDDPQGNAGGGQDGSGCDGQVPSTKRRKDKNDTDPVVKTEGEEPVPAKTARTCHKAPSIELHIYSAAELSPGSISVSFSLMFNFLMVCSSSPGYNGYFSLSSL
jgi:hypothetical protein